MPSLQLQGLSRTRTRKSTGQQSGMYVVEFAIVSALFMFLLFACFEVSRLLFTWSALDAATQRGARAAAICTRGSDTVKRIAIFGADGSSDSPVIPGVTENNVQVRYLTDTGAVANAATWPSFVEVSVVNYNHQMAIPEVFTNFVSPNLLSPSFITLRPSESLGFDPVSGDFSC